MKVHELKIKHEYCIQIVVGAKSFEIRKNDRNFQSGDILHLKEIDDETGEYTGFELFVKVNHLHSGLGMQEGYVCMSIKKVRIEEERR